MFHHIPCRNCYYCRKKTFAQCDTYKRVGVTAGFEPSGGGFAGYVRVMDWIVSGGGLIKIPDGVSFDQASFVEPLSTCLKGVKALDLQADETVLVIGQGSIGIMLAVLAARSGARVFTSDMFDERHKLAGKFGLSLPISAKTEDVVARLKAETSGRGADAVILAVGGSALIKTAMDSARPGGRVMLFAQTQREEAIFDPASICVDEKTLLGSYSASVDLQDEAADIVFSGNYDLTQLISHHFTLEQAVEAIEMASTPKANFMKGIIKP